MKKINKILIIGLGAVGSIYATRFYDWNPASIRVLLDETRIERYKKSGIIFNDKKYDFEYILPAEQNFKADLIIIATKNSDLKSAVKMIKNFVDEDTIILSLLNGISSEEIIANKYGAKYVLRSYYIGHASVRSGAKIDYDGVGKIIFGDENNFLLSEKVKRVKTLFEECGIEYEIPEDMKSAMWKKFVINIGINQASAIHRADYGELQSSLEFQKTARELMEEAVKIAKALEVKDAESFIDEAFNLINSMPSDLKCSMLQDVESGRKTEVAAFAGEICRLGKKLNIPTPKNQEALRLLEI